MSASATSSVAAWEAYELLKAGARKEYRFEGDTKGAAFDRAARQAGLTSAQAERLRKNWKTMKFPNGDVYRLLRNKYGHLCSWIEQTADRIDREAEETEVGNAAHSSTRPTVASTETKAQRAP